MNCVHVFHNLMYFPFHFILVQANSSHFCIICKAGFSSRNDRNDHLETHFVHKDCNHCSRPVLLIGDLEFELHRPTHCIKTIEEIVEFDENAVIETEIETEIANISTKIESIQIESIQIEPVMQKDVLYKYQLKTGPKPDQMPRKRTKTAVDYCELNGKRKAKPPTRANTKRLSAAPLKAEHINIDSNAVDDGTACNNSPNPKLDFEVSDSEDIVIKEMDGELKKRRRYRRLPKIVPCTECDAMFGSERTLKIHLKQVHGIKEPLVCKICSREFKISGNLKQHIATHSDQKRYICNYCGKGFHLPYNLNEHMNIHTGARPYTCETCGKTFSRSTLKQAHKRVSSFSDICRFGVQPITAVVIENHGKLIILMLCVILDSYRRKAV